eukprot:CAMPEP_0114694076 /NCGR_PEP_ID=MMETSP0191-20121206/69761_1 /TAXON_ID=126664 /ORGANISM="Sorites sp." /LENGTH=40 /DNA_ID= /DNA_START= /DNA_END= /DNA_ORIENTATION=
MALAPWTPTAPTGSSSSQRKISSLAANARIAPTKPMMSAA